MLNVLTQKTNSLAAWSTDGPSNMNINKGAQPFVPEVNFPKVESP